MFFYLEMMNEDFLGSLDRLQLVFCCSFLLDASSALMSQETGVLAIADKIGTIALLIYVAYALSRKLDKMHQDFQTEEAEIREHYKEEIRLLSEAHEKTVQSLLDSLKKREEENRDLIKILYRSGLIRKIESGL